MPADGMRLLSWSLVSMIVCLWVQPCARLCLVSGGRLQVGYQGRFTEAQSFALQTGPIYVMDGLCNSGMVAVLLCLIASHLLDL